MHHFKGVKCTLNPLLTLGHFVLSVALIAALAVGTNWLFTILAICLLIWNSMLATGFMVMSNLIKNADADLEAQLDEAKNAGK
tara:strand:+ start:3939 stop:4187 length:249 start_codon:yes stop_codon:yes gene_type:complete